MTNNMTKQNKKWEDEFDEKEVFPFGIWHDHLYKKRKDYIKQFISEQLEKRTMEIVEEFGHFNDGCECCSNNWLESEILKKYNL